MLTVSTYNNVYSILNNWCVCINLSLRADSLFYSISHSFQPRPFLTACRKAGAKSFGLAQNFSLEKQITTTIYIYIYIFMCIYIYIYMPTLSFLPQKCTSKGIGRQGVVLKHRNPLQKEHVPCRHMPL